ncbi:MAG: integrator complex subunit 9 [Ruthenibacterium lactatiformans]
MSEGGVTKKMVFSGDVGNTHQPILNDPQRVEQADYLVLESTYGNRLHGERPDYVGALTEILQQTFDRGGTVVIPSFAVGRTQEMLYFIREIKEQGRVHGHDGFPVYVDSPPANEATSIFLQCPTENLDPEARELVLSGVNPLWFEGLRTSVTKEDSQAINANAVPKVILSASGMCDAGRIRHHLKHNLWHSENTVLFVGYQAEGTLARAGGRRTIGKNIRRSDRSQRRNPRAGGRERGTRIKTGSSAGSRVFHRSRRRYSSIMATMKHVRILPSA